jgi:hypothetical protein
MYLYLSAYEADSLYWVKKQMNVCIYPYLETNQTNICLCIGEELVTFILVLMCVVTDHSNTCI